MADQPRPLDAQTWRLSLGGSVTTPRDFSYDELVAAGDALEATLDSQADDKSGQPMHENVLLPALFTHLFATPHVGSCSYVFSI